MSWQSRGSRRPFSPSRAAMTIQQTKDPNGQCVGIGVISLLDNWACFAPRLCFGWLILCGSLSRGRKARSPPAEIFAQRLYVEAAKADIFSARRAPHTHPMTHETSCGNGLSMDRVSCNQTPLGVPPVSPYAADVDRVDTGGHLVGVCVGSIQGGSQDRKSALRKAVVQGDGLDSLQPGWCL